jgi:hypothetical protein
MLALHSDSHFGSFFSQTSLNVLPDKWEVVHIYLLRVFHSLKIIVLYEICVIFNSEKLTSFKILLSFRFTEPKYFAGIINLDLVSDYVQLIDLNSTLTLCHLFFNCPLVHLHESHFKLDSGCQNVDTSILGAYQRYPLNLNLVFKEHLLYLFN